MANTRDIPGRDLVKAVERPIVVSYDHELAQFRSMKRFGWGTVLLALLAAASTIFGAEPYNGLLALMAGAAALGWLVSRAEWQSTRARITTLESELGAHRIYVGGHGRDVYLTTNAYDNAWGDAVGEWLRSPLPTGLTINPPRVSSVEMSTCESTASAWPLKVAVSAVQNRIPNCRACDPR